MNNQKKKWENHCNRFVAYFDIMGFKAMVMNKSHDDVVQKLIDTRNGRIQLFDGTWEGMEMENNLKSFQFSDSFFIFSNSDTAQDAFNILHSSNIFLTISMQLQIPLKGVISYGEITADFDNTIFVGKPIVEAYLLHEELEMYGAVLDINAENKINEKIKEIKWGSDFSWELVQYKIPAKTLNITCQCLDWPHIVVPKHPSQYHKNDPIGKKFWVLLHTRKYLENFNETVPDYARRYVENSLVFYQFLIDEARRKYPGIKDFIYPKRHA